MAAILTSIQVSSSILFVYFTNELSKQIFCTSLNLSLKFSFSFNPKKLYSSLHFNSQLPLDLYGVTLFCSAQIEMKPCNLAS